jgi:orotidine-5'-phosphate decarboxylase
MSLDEARPFIESMKDNVGLFKIGLTLLMGEGVHVIKKIKEITGKENKFFLDVKFSDIPQQVGGIAAVLMSESKSVEFITVHLHEGEARIKETVKKFKTNETKILGVTVLTSRDDNDLKEEGSSLTAEEMVLKRAGIAKRSDCSGVVCSGHEAKLVKAQYGQDFIVVTPGIRPAWSLIENDDQRRIMTPGNAISNGADYIVVGRPIYKAKDPVEAAQKIAGEIETALKEKPAKS